MKSTLFILTIMSSILFGNDRILKTSKYGGTYRDIKNATNGRIGWADIYPESDTTILFYLSLNRGAPSFNMGQKYGRLTMKNNIGIYYFKNDWDSLGCKLIFSFSKDTLTIKTPDSFDECGYGYGVYSDGVFEKHYKKIPKYFIELTGDTTYFDKVKPEKWEAK